MKLIFCKNCHDVVKLGSWGGPRFCQCGKSWGQYEPDGLQGVIGGEAIALGLDNFTLAEAIRNRPEDGMGPGINAWVFPKTTSRIAFSKSLPRET